jgi:tetratricopeptide (TPR) repeat protein
MRAEAGYVLFELALRYVAEGRAKTAVQCCRRALEQLERPRPGETRRAAEAEWTVVAQTVAVLGLLGKLYEYMDELRRARRCFERAMQLLDGPRRRRRRTRRPGAPGLLNGDAPLERDVARVEVQAALNLADLEQSDGRYRAAEALYRRALATLDDRLDPDEALEAAILNGLGVLYKRSGRYDEAALIYRRALRLAEATFGAMDGHIASICHNLAGLEHARGRARLGEPYARRALVIRLKAVRAETDDPLIAVEMTTLGALLEAQGALDEAERTYGRALEIFERHPHRVRQQRAVALHNMGAIHYLRGRPALAGRFYRRALTIKRRVLPRSHPEIAVTLHNLAVLNGSQGHRPHARRLINQALAMFRRTLGPRHPRVAACEAVAASIESGAPLAALQAAILN